MGKKAPAAKRPKTGQDITKFFDKRRFVKPASVDNRLPGKSNQGQPAPSGQPNPTAGFSRHAIGARQGSGQTPGRPSGAPPPRTGAQITEPRPTSLRDAVVQAKRNQAGSGHLEARPSASSESRPCNSIRAPRDRNAPLAAASAAAAAAVGTRLQGSTTANHRPSACPAPAASKEPGTETTCDGALAAVSGLHQNSIQAAEGEEEEETRSKQRRAAAGTSVSDQPSHSTGSAGVASGSGQFVSLKRGGLEQTKPSNNVRQPSRMRPSSHANTLAANTLAAPCGGLQGARQVPKTGISQDLDEYAERVVYEASPQQCLQPGAAGQLVADDEDVGMARRRLISAVQRAPGSQEEGDSGRAGGALMDGREGRSQDAFFEELLLLPPPTHRARSKPDLSRKPLTSNLNPASSLKQPSAERLPAAAKASPSTSSATPKEGVTGGPRKFARVSFNPAVSVHSGGKSPSCSSCSHSSARLKRFSRGLAGSIQKGGSGSKRGSRKRKTLLDLLDQVESLMQGDKAKPEPETPASPAKRHAVDKENVSSFERASQEIELASQELSASQKGKARLATLWEDGLLDEDREGDPAAAAAPPNAAGKKAGAVLASTDPEHREAWLSSQAGVFERRRPEDALEELEAELAAQLEEAALNARQAEAQAPARQQRAESQPGIVKQPEKQAGSRQQRAGSQPSAGGMLQQGLGIRASQPQPEWQPFSSQQLQAPHQPAWQASQRPLSTTQAPAGNLQHTTQRPRTGGLPRPQAPPYGQGSQTVAGSSAPDPQQPWHHLQRPTGTPRVQVQPASQAAQCADGASERQPSGAASKLAAAADGGGVAQGNLPSGDSHDRPADMDVSRGQRKAGTHDEHKGEQHAGGRVPQGEQTAPHSQETVLADLSNHVWPGGIGSQGVLRSPKAKEKKLSPHALHSGPLSGWADDDFGELDAGLARLLDGADAAQPSGDARRDGAVVDATAREGSAQAGLLAKGSPPDCSKVPDIGMRFIVLEVQESMDEKLLRLVSTANGQEVVAHLRDGWIDQRVGPGELVNLVAKLDSLDDGLHALCSYSTGMLIVQPDVLLSGTLVSGSYQCARKSVLQERFGGSSGVRAVQGTLLHELFQMALVQEAANADAMQAAARAIIRRNAEKLLEVGQDEYQAMAVMEEAIPTMLAWLAKFRTVDPVQGAMVSVSVGNGTDVEEGFCIGNVTDIEESIWAPKYGLKGMVDASVEVGFQASTSGRDQQQGAPKSWHGWGSKPSSERATAQRHSAPAGRMHRPQVRRMLAPLEFKTGKAHQSHRAQVLLYLLLMEDRYGVAMERGLLQYLNQGPPQVVQRAPTELSALIMQRNLLAANLAASQQLPPVIQDPRSCANCFQLAACTITHKGLEGGTAESAGMGPAFEQQTGHLTSTSMAFLQQWLRLVALEEEGLLRRRAEIWTLPGAEREQQGKCIAGLVYEAGSERQTAGRSGEPRFVYSFRRATAVHCTPLSLPAPKELDKLGFGEGELVVLSVEDKHPCVARGVIASLEADRLELSSNKRLRESLLEGEGPAPGAPAPEAPQRWRVDKDEVSSGFTRMRQNILRLLAKGNPVASRLRQLVVDLQAPISRPDSAAEPAAPKLLESLNNEQREAVSRVLSAQDYTIILGLPGTGKTSTIARAVMALLAQGKSVLVTAYTNSAVDNILLKLAEQGAPLLRLGRPEGVHPALQAWLPGGAKHPDVSVAGLKRLAKTAMLVGSTSLGADSAMLANRTFDVCIVDEAGQMSLPVCLGPLLKARAFSLVGDHYQLPPLVQNAAAAAGGLATSLFRRLCEAHPQAVVALRAQYRMAEDIQLLANTLVYNGSLRCGSKTVGDATLPVQLTPELRGSYPPWMLQVLDPARRVIFLDTDALDAQESQSGDTMSNVAEAAILQQITAALAAGGVPLADIGLVSPYRSQVALLQRQATQRNWRELEVLTVDRCQGRDKAALLLSLVRSNAARSAGRLLADWRRVNVALTRAKQKLVLVGSAATLATVPLFGELLTLVREKGWLMQLPADALTKSA